MEKSPVDIKTFNKSPLIQYGPPRTGSTLLWNILRIAYPERDVLKLHRLDRCDESVLDGSNIVATIRNPLDMISSSIQRYEKEPTMEVVDQQLTEFERLGIWDILKLKGSPKAMVLKYEDFAFDWDYAFRKIEEFEGVRISEESKQICLVNYSIHAVKKRAVALGSFSNYDKNDHIHGKHISRFRGRVGYYSELLSGEMINEIYTRFAGIFAEFDYQVEKSVKQR